ncbi:MAG: hypothetical protein JXR07_18015 [Reichenbachiella sp.]
MPQSTKYQAPHLLDDYFERNDLITSINQVHRCTMVIAASGYGKSSLVANWLSQVEGRSLWVNLSSADNDLLSFVEVLARGFKSLHINGYEAFSEILNNSEAILGEDLIAAFLSNLSTIQQDTILVLDDYHLIQDDTVHALMTRMVESEHIPLNVVITSRFDPPFPLFIWNQKGWLNQVRSKQLKFDAQATHDFLSTKFDGLDGGLTEQLSNQMEGWITGICLLIYNVNTQEQLSSKVNKIATDQSKDMLTLTHWYLDQLKLEVKEVVLKLAMFGHFSKDMMLSMFPKKEAITLFNDILHSKLLIISLEGEGGWYRFHHLFQETLVKISESYFEQKVVNELLAKGAQYYEEYGNKERAIVLYLQAGLVNSAFEVFDIYRKKLLDQRQWGVFERLYHQLSKHNKESLVLQLSLCWLHIRHGKTQELFELTGVLAQRFQQDQIQESDDPELFAEFYSIKSYKNYNVDQDFDACVHDCEFALQHLNSEWLNPRGYAWVFLLGSMQIKGQMDLIEQRITAAIDKEGVSDFEKGYILFVSCYLYWMELDLYKMNAAAEALIDLGTSQKNKEFEAHGWHFKLLFSTSRGDWKTAFEQIQSKDELMDHAIGVIRVFYQISKAVIIGQNQHSFDSTEYFHELFNERYVDRNQTQALIIRARVAELEMLQGDTEKACLMLKELGEQPLYPLSNTVDIQLVRLNCYLSSKNEAYWQEAFESIIILAEFYLNSHNAMGQLYVNIYRSIYHHLMGEGKQSISFMNQALELAIPSGITFPFLQTNHVIEPVLAQVIKKTNYDKFATSILNQLSNKRDDSTAVNISLREKDIIDLMIKKLSNKEIGEQLFISEKTVKNHSNSIFKKLGVKNRREAAQRAIELSLQR